MGIIVLLSLVFGWLSLSFLLFGMLTAFNKRSLANKIYNEEVEYNRVIRRERNPYENAYTCVKYRMSRHYYDYFSFIDMAIPLMFCMGIFLVFILYISEPLNKRVWYGFLYRPKDLFNHRSMQHMLHNAEPPEWIGKRKPDWKI